MPSGGTSLLLLGVGFLAITFKMSLATLVGVLFNVGKTSWNLWRETDEKGQARALGIFKEQLEAHAPKMDDDKERDVEYSSFSLKPSEEKLKKIKVCFYSIALFFIDTIALFK